MLQFEVQNHNPSVGLMDAGFYDLDMSIITVRKSMSIWRKQKKDDPLPRETPAVPSKTRT